MESDGIKQPVVHDGGERHSNLHPLTLVFASDSLELAYRRYTHRRMLPVLRFGLVLAVVLYLLYGAFDARNIPDALTFTWGIRSVVILAGLVLLTVSFREFFVGHRETAMAGYSVLLSMGLLAIFSVASDEVMDRYHVGFVLVPVATFTVFGLRFPNAAIASFAALSIYLLSEYLFRDDFSMNVAENAVVVSSAAILGGLAGYATELQRRLAFFRGRLLEQARAESEHDALHDPLTLLPNRRLLMERMTHALARDKRFNTRLAVLFIDLDDFKPINDTHGHAFGDKVLHQVGERLLSCVRGTDTVTRLGGDEFVVLLEDLQDATDAELLLARIREAFTAEFTIDGMSFHIGLSVGCAVHPRDGDDPRTLLEHADREMYQAKKNHGRR